MRSPNELYRQLHPDQFSDSQIIRASKLDRAFFEYYLSTLTSRGEEKKFEVFCRMIAEKEICPNLLPQTGPTGGGDSKVDSETFPISDLLPITYFSGIGKESSQERWAFAFSATQKWKPKVYSDVKKIYEINQTTARGYTKIFFISNQYISDRNRSTVEDDLRLKYSVDVRILDRNWLLEVMFSKGNENIAIRCFELSDDFRSDIRKGPGDYSKELDLEKVETALANYDSNSPKAGMINLALEAAMISRRLELPKDAVISRFQKTWNIIENCGMQIHKSDCLYEWAWTLFWWFEDYEAFYEKYCKFEKLAIDSGNIHELDRLAILWVNLQTCTYTNSERFQIEFHSNSLLNSLSSFINDKTQPHAAFEAAAILLRIKMIEATHEEPNQNTIGQIVKECISIVDHSDEHLDFDLLQFGKIINQVGFLEEASQYEVLFELLTEKLAARKKETERAKLLIQRAAKIASSKPIRAISFLGRALQDLYKNESKDDLVVALSYLAYCFESIGCYWSARNYHLYVFSLCLSQYMKYGEINPAIVFSAHSMTMLEIQFGRIEYALSFHDWTRIARNINWVENLIDQDDKDINDLFDGMLAIAMLKIPFENLKASEFLVSKLESRDLYAASVALKYMLGYYDDPLLEALNGSKSDFDKNMQHLFSQPGNLQIRFSPTFGTEASAVIQANVLGCVIAIQTGSDFFDKELGASILSMVEAFFSTAVDKQIMIQQAEFTIRIFSRDETDFRIFIDEAQSSPSELIIRHSTYSAGNLSIMQDRVNKFLKQLFPSIVSRLVVYELSKDAMEDLITEEAAFGRTFAFCNSIFFPVLVLGDNFGLSAYERDSDPTNKFEYTLIRSAPVAFEPCSISSADEVDERNKQISVRFGSMPDFDWDNVSHQQMKVISVIKLSLWEEAKWQGIGVIAPPVVGYPPLLGLIFSDFIAGEKILKDWISRIGYYDKDDLIQIGIIKGIDKKNPYHYRVIITSKVVPSTNSSGANLFQILSRLHTMQAKNSYTLSLLETAIGMNVFFNLLQMTAEADGPVPHTEAAIKKNVSSITIRNAWEVEGDSFLLTGMLPTDDPILPPGSEDAPIIKALEFSRSKTDLRKIGRNEPCPCGSGKKYKHCCMNNSN